jgi:hypothetical protein
MHIFLLVFLLQGQANTHPSVDLSTPQTTSVRQSQQPASPSPSLDKPKENTTPGLTAETALHLQMERELGGQAEAVGDLKARVSGLEDKRENHDRPDIDDLKTSRLHVLWTTSILGTVLATLLAVFFKFQKIIWGEVLRPRLVRELSGSGVPAEQTKS